MTSSRNVIHYAPGSNRVSASSNESHDAGPGQLPPTGSRRRAALGHSAATYAAASWKKTAPRIAFCRPKSPPRRLPCLPDFTSHRWVRPFFRPSLKLTRLS